MKKLFSFFIFTAFLFIGFIGDVNAKQISTPTILEIGKKASINNQDLFYIKGLTIPGTEVVVYINGELSGYGQVKSQKTSADNFYYFAPIATSTNQIEIKVFATDKKSQINSEPWIKKFENSFLSVPTLIFPSNNDFIIDTKIKILGLSKNDTIVKIIIDGKIVGKTAILNNRSSTANFSYLYSKILNQGEHQVALQAENLFGNVSSTSPAVNFNIMHPMPAPILKEVVVNKNTNNNQPFVTGLAKNNSIISVFIDNEYDGQLLVVNHKSGTASFAYKPSQKLFRGMHTAYATATDLNGKESKLSNPINFQIKTPMITEAESAEEKKAIGKIAELESDNDQLLDKKKLNNNQNEEKNILNQSEVQSEEANNPNQEIQDILGQKTNSNNIGLINENKNKNTKINFNLIIFIATLLGIIAWIIWVNKELIKEKKREIKDESRNQLNDQPMVSNERKQPDEFKD